MGNISQILITTLPSKQAEATVKSMKKLISSTWNRSSADWERLCRALLQYRNTPCRKDAVSPAQKLFGHPVQDHLPAHRRSFSPEWQTAAQTIDAAGDASLGNAQMAYDQHAHPLPEHSVGAHVAIQNPNLKLWDIYGTVTAIAPFRRYFRQDTKWQSTSLEPEVFTEMISPFCCSP